MHVVACIFCVTGYFCASCIKVCVCVCAHLCVSAAGECFEKVMREYY